ncbi:RNA-binding protein 8A [Trichinella britovi]|uniref:RNA-binding protein 8A n=1 Tax=Trichinella britovi TaxID=45882 RepID=A0A0V1CP22_TRIBR|nr:RNA-binding protein 8A [Trichinella britovi]
MEEEVAATYVSDEELDDGKMCYIFYSAVKFRHGSFVIEVEDMKDDYTSDNAGFDVPRRRRQLSGDEDDVDEVITEDDIQDDRAVTIQQFRGRGMKSLCFLSSICFSLVTEFLNVEANRIGDEEGEDEERVLSKPVPSVDGWTIIVSNLHQEAEEDEIKQAFEDFGPVKTINILLNRETGYLTGVAIIEYEVYDMALEAVQTMNGATFLGKKLKVDWLFIEKPKPISRA